MNCGILSIKKTLILLVTVLLLSGYSGFVSASETKKIYDQLPAWFFKPPVSDGVVSAIGISHANSDLNEAIKEADLHARLMLQLAFLRSSYKPDSYSSRLKFHFMQDGSDKLDELVFRQGNKGYFANYDDIRIKNREILSNGVVISLASYEVKNLDVSTGGTANLLLVKNDFFYHATGDVVDSIQTLKVGLKAKNFKYNYSVEASGLNDVVTYKAGSVRHEKNLADKKFEDSYTSNVVLDKFILNSLGPESVVSIPVKSMDNLWDGYLLAWFLELNRALQYSNKNKKMLFDVISSNNASTPVPGESVKDASVQTYHFDSAIHSVAASNDSSKGKDGQVKRSFQGSISSKLNNNFRYMNINSITLDREKDHYVMQLSLESAL